MYADPESGPGPYAIGYRGECWIGERMVAAWNEEDWEGHSAPESADAAARNVAEFLATYRRGEPDEDDTLSFFEWAGGPV